MLTLLGMMRSRAPEIIPSRKVIAGRLLDEAASTVDQKLFNILKGQALGAVCVYFDRLISRIVSEHIPVLTAGNHLQRTL